jgi:hypothetical protein
MHCRKVNIHVTQKSHRSLKTTAHQGNWASQKNPQQGLRSAALLEQLRVSQRWTVASEWDGPSPSSPLKETQEVPSQTKT